MNLFLIRHGTTAGNSRSRYIGRTDEPLSAEGILQAKNVCVKTEFTKVYVSPMKRSVQTASILFPKAEQVVIEDFREMDFGVFENRSADEMENDPAYRNWVDGWCAGRCPNGESRAEFSDRVCRAFASLMDSLREEGAETAVMVVHGGTIMAILERYAVPKREYFNYWVNNCGIYACRVRDGLPLVLEDPEQRECME